MATRLQNFLNHFWRPILIDLYHESYLMPIDVVEYVKEALKVSFTIHSLDRP